VDESVPVDEVVQVGRCRKPITKEKIESLALEKYRASGRGITTNDLEIRFSIKQVTAQRCFKYIRSRGILFTAQDLIRHGINLLRNKSPQEYYASCIKAEILENARKRNKSVLVGPTGALSNSSKHPLSNVLEYQKASSFLAVLASLPFAPPYLHKLQLMFHLDKQFYKELKQKEEPVNRAKPYEEIIGRRHVTYKLSPNGTVEVYIRSTDTPLRIESDEDISAIFAFLGQVRDRFLYHVGDIKERHVPPLMSWVLKQCDLNKDIEISDKAQITLPDIELKQADRVFRIYIKILEGKAYYRAEESLTLNQVLLEAIDSIRHPYKSIENKIEYLIELLTTTISHDTQPQIPNKRAEEDT
jgi:hypothetical protein